MAVCVVRGLFLRHERPFVSSEDSGRRTGRSDRRPALATLVGLGLDAPNPKESTAFLLGPSLFRSPQDPKVHFARLYDLGPGVERSGC
jgi:hypothetical protein